MVASVEEQIKTQVVKQFQNADWTIGNVTKSTNKIYDVFDVYGTYEIEITAARDVSVPGNNNNAYSKAHKGAKAICIIHVLHSGNTSSSGVKVVLA